MKNILKSGIRMVIGGGLLCSFLLTGCDLDFENTKAINPDNVWQDKNMILGYLSDIHGGMMPGWGYGNGNNTDEMMNKATQMSEWARGIIGVEKDGKGFDYGNIDKINFLLNRLETVPTTVLTETESKQIKGQALFWRAWDYFGKVATFGGVPLILNVQDYTNPESLFVPRSKTSECITQILQDLDDAIAWLPDTWDDANYGRIDKGAAMAFKGRVLLWYASPLFNPSNDATRWNEAYQANKDAVDFLKSVGKGLYPDYTQLWNDEQNEEVIMVNQFYYPDHVVDQKDPRPEPLTKANANIGQPIFQLMEAFPQKDGSILKLDADRLASDPAYNSEYMERFLNNRDDRFYTTIFIPGTRYPSTDDAPGGQLAGGQKFWSTWKDAEDGTYLSMVVDQMSRGQGDMMTGFYGIKGLDESLDQTHVHEGETDWVEIRFAEVLMNYGECANEVGKDDEALDVLYQIRKRANIEAGVDGRYGITATSQDEIRKAYMDERFVEFAYEGMRSDDLRRWKRWDMLNQMKHRHGLYIVINDNNDVANFDWTWNIRDKEVMDKFHLVYVDNMDRSDDFTFNYDLEHWFWPINKEGMDRNPKLVQNKEWGGTFDPLD